MNTSPPAPDIPRAVFIRTAEKRLVVWFVALLLAIAPNGWVLVSHLCKGTIDRGATYGTLASIYLITALGYFEARFVTRLIIREPLMKGAFSVFGLLMWLVSAGCCVVSWLGADVQDPIAWNPHLTWAAGIVAVAIVAEGFLAAEYIRWGKIA